MLNAMTAARAYAASATHRSLRDQEADVFRRANASLRKCLTQGTRARKRALADNGRLWSTVIDLVRDPQNTLPDGLRAAIISVGLAVQRDMQAATPNFDFLISINDNIAAGLAGQP
jgi:flagellar protein FlaF